MARFRFALEKVLEHRRRLVDLRSLDLAAAESRAAAAAAAIADLRGRQRRSQETAAEPGAVDVGRLAARTAWVDHLDRLIAAAERDRSAALAAVAAARQALETAWREREVLAQLRERRHREWTLQERRRETVELDEIGGRRRARVRQSGFAG